MGKVAADIEDGEEITAEHLENLGCAFSETLNFIDEQLVPLVDDPEKVRWEFELPAEELDKD